MKNLRKSDNIGQGEASYFIRLYRHHKQRYIYDTKSKSGIVTSISFTKTEPYSLYVELDYEENELVIEFTGKILHDRYSELINSNNVEVCLKNIETECGCKLDIPSILQDNKVVKIDVSKDIEYPDCKGLTAYLSSYVKNYKKYLPRIIGGNFVIEKNVKTRGYKKRMTVYDKYKEMQKASNKSFREIPVVISTACKLGTLWHDGNLETKRKTQKLVYPSGVFWDKENRCYRTENRNKFGSNEKVGRKRQNTPLQLRCEQGAQRLMHSLSPI